MHHCCAARTPGSAGRSNVAGRLTFAEDGSGSDDGGLPAVDTPPSLTDGFGGMQTELTAEEDAILWQHEQEHLAAAGGRAAGGPARAVAVAAGGDEAGRGAVGDGAGGGVVNLATAVGGGGTLPHPVLAVAAAPPHVDEFSGEAYNTGTLTSEMLAVLGLAKVYQPVFELNQVPVSIPSISIF